MPLKKGKSHLFTENAENIANGHEDCLFVTSPVSKMRNLGIQATSDSKWTDQFAAAAKIAGEGLFRISSACPAEMWRFQFFYIRPEIVLHENLDYETRGN